MDRTRWILSNLSVVNIILAAVLIVFANNMFLPLFGKSSRLLLPPLKKQAAVSATTAEKPGEGKSPSPSDYFLIAEQNIFHPERKIPVEKKNIVAPPLPKPDFVLYGTLMLDDVRIAYMEDMKAPQSSPSRGKKQIPLRQGDALSGFVLKEVNNDKVVVVRGDEKIEVYLNKSKTRDASPLAKTATTAPQSQPAQLAPQQQQSVQSPQTVQDANPQSPQQMTQGLRALFNRRANRISNYNNE